MVGEFEKPRFFAYNAKICAHSRSSKAGCNQCLDVCSTRRDRAGRRSREGRPASVHGLRRLRDRLSLGRDDLRLSARARPRRAAEALLSIYREAGGKDACLLFHNAARGPRGECALARRGQGLAGAGDSARDPPPRVGRHGPAARRACLRRKPGRGARDRQDRGGYVEALKRQMGYRGEHRRRARLRGTRISISSTSSMRCGSSRRRRRSAKPATFNLSSEKRTTLDFALDASGGRNEDKEFHCRRARPSARWR